MAQDTAHPDPHETDACGDTDEELRERVKDLEFLLAFNAAINQGEDSISLMRRFSEHAARAFHSDSSAVYRLSLDGHYLELEPLTWAHRLPGQAGRIVRGLLPTARVRLEEGGMYRRILSGGKPVTTDDRADRVRMALEFEGSEGFEWIVEQVVDGTGKCVISVPILVGDQPLGMLDLSRDAPFTRCEAERLQGMADQLAVLFRQRETLEALARSEQRVRALVQSMRDIAYVVDPRGVIVETWGAWPEGLPLVEDPVGHTLSEVIGEEAMLPHKLAMREAIRLGERRCEWTLGPEGPRQRCFETVLSPGLADEEAVVCVARDITYHSHLERALQEAAWKDHLTGLLNRRGFMLLAKQGLAVSKRQETPATVIYADLDGLKSINDDVGHDMGDLALRETADLLADTFRESDIIGRLGGDEFAVLVLDASPSAVKALVERLRERIADRAPDPGHPYPLSMSLGIASDDPQGRQSIEGMLRAADARMYAAKRMKRDS